VAAPTFLNAGTFLDASQTTTLITGGVITFVVVLLICCCMCFCSFYVHRKEKDREKVLVTVVMAGGEKGGGYQQAGVEVGVGNVKVVVNPMVKQPALRAPRVVEVVPHRQPVAAGAHGKATNINAPRHSVVVTMLADRIDALVRPAPPCSPPLSP
jgi:hypothetical protein